MFDYEKRNVFKKILLIGSIFLVVGCTCFQDVYSVSENSSAEISPITKVEKDNTLTDKSIDETPTQDKYVEIENKFVIDLEKVPKELLNKAEKKEITKKFFKTDKRETSGSNLSRVEIEEEISKEQYDSVLKEINPDFYIKNIGTI